MSDSIDGPQRVRARGARNRAENRDILFRQRPRNMRRAWDEAIRATKDAPKPRADAEIMARLGWDDAVLSDTSTDATARIADATIRTVNARIRRHANGETP